MAPRSPSGGSAACPLLGPVLSEGARCRFWVTVLLVAGVAACGGSAASTPDAGTVGIELEIGGGEFQFVPYQEGGPIQVVCGPQGGQHIWVSLRGRGFDPSRVDVVVGIELIETGSRVCGQQLQQVPMLPNGDRLEYTGIICFVPDPELIRGRSIRITAQLTDAASRTGSASLTGISVGPDRSCALAP